MTDTKARILDVAEELFAEHGIAATSLRQIMTVAELNPASVHYHFGGKDQLVEALVARRLDPVNEERQKLLDAIEARSPEGPLPVEDVLEALFAPALRLAGQPERGGARFMRLMGRFYNETTASALEMLEDKLRPIVERFAKALHRSLPAIDPQTFAWRLHYAIGAMAHTMACREMIRWISEEAAEDDVDRALHELVQFARAGLLAPNTQPTKGAEA